MRSSIRVFLAYRCQSPDPRRARVPDCQPEANSHGVLSESKRTMGCFVMGARNSSPSSKRRQIWWLPNPVNTSPSPNGSHAIHDIELVCRCLIIRPPCAHLGTALAWNERAAHSMTLPCMHGIAGRCGTCSCIRPISGTWSRFGPCQKAAGWRLRHPGKLTMPNRRQMPSRFRPSPRRLC